MSIKYAFEVNGRIKNCSECPFGNDIYKSCRLYSDGHDDRYFYEEYEFEKPPWCELKELIQNGEGSYKLYDPKEYNEYLTEMFKVPLKKLDWSGYNVMTDIT